MSDRSERERLLRERDSWTAVGGGNPHVLAIAAQTRLDEFDGECPMCGWTPGTNPQSCGECASRSATGPRDYGKGQ